MSAVAAPVHRKAASRMREILATYEKNKDLIMLGAYAKGTDRRVDEAIDRIDEVIAFLRQATDQKVPLENSVAELKRMFAAQA